MIDDHLPCFFKCIDALIVTSVFERLIVQGKKGCE